MVEHRIGEYVGPCTVIAHDVLTKTVLVQNESNEKHERYSCAQVKPFLASATVERKTPEVIVIDYLQQLRDAMTSYQTPMTALDVRLTEVIQPDDPHAKDPRMQEAMNEEVKNLLRRGTSKVILKEEMPDGANVLTAH